MIEFGNDKLGVSNVKVDYTQDADSMSADDFQTLSVEATDAGGGWFFVIQTERWAFDNIDEFVKILKDFQKRVGVKK